MSKNESLGPSVSLTKLQYPIGTFRCPEVVNKDLIHNWIDAIAVLPAQVEQEIHRWADHQLDTPYRPHGWTVRQVVHHLADSHHHSYIRFKWALTEENPLIKAYDEKEWASLVDARTAPVSLALQHLKAVHARLVYLLSGLSSEQLARTFTHPETGTVHRLDENIGRYAWHGSHHLAHILNLKASMGWS